MRTRCVCETLRVTNSIDSHASMKAFEKIGQMRSSLRQIICSITVVTSLAMENFCYKELSPSTYD